MATANSWHNIQLSPEFNQYSYPMDTRLNFGHSRTLAIMLGVLTVTLSHHEDMCDVKAKNPPFFVSYKVKTKHMTIT